MRSSIIGLAAAAVVGISVVAVPPAIAARSTPSAGRVSNASTAAVPGAAQSQVTSVSTDTSSVAMARKECSYPTNRTTLSLQPSSAKYSHPTRVTFHGRLKLNKCGLAKRVILLHSVRSHSVVGRSVTNANGFFSISVRVKRSSSYYATFAGDKTYKPARSNNSHITIGH